MRKNQKTVFRAIGCTLTSFKLRHPKVAVNPPAPKAISLKARERTAKKAALQKRLHFCLFSSRE